MMINNVSFTGIKTNKLFENISHEYLGRGEIFPEKIVAEMEAKLAESTTAEEALAKLIKTPFQNHRAPIELKDLDALNAKQAGIEYALAHGKPLEGI